MRKLLVVLLILMLGVTVSVLAGCGGDTSTAKADLKQADADYNALNKDLTQLQSSLTTTIGGAVSGNYSAITPQIVQTADATISKALAEMPKIKAEYQKVDSLKGVSDYKSYADAMVKAVDANMAALQQGKQFIDGLTPIVSNQAAVAQYFTTNGDALNNLQSVNNAASTAYQDAQTIKQDKNLSY